MMARGSGAALAMDSKCTYMVEEISLRGHLDIEVKKE